MITSVLVANRGEIARRVFRTCRDLGLSTVAVYSDADADAPFVSEADAAVHLAGSAPADTYLRVDLLIEAARRSGADAVHPGYGFLSENADFAQAVQAAGLTWIGPSPAAIRSMGSKIEAKRLMAAAGVPVLDQLDPDTITESNLPVLIKASSGGGGRGMRVVHTLSDLPGELALASAEAASAFGDPTVFCESYFATGHHIEVQIMVDDHGTVWALGERECSIQRRHQKIIEETPSPLVERLPAMRARLFAASIAAAQAIGYTGAGTVEFLADDDGRFFFLEMNTRLQVEHPVTECVTGTDLVALQLDVADGGTLAPAPPEPVGHSIEVRLYAENPAADWQPQSGVLYRFDVPGVSAHFDLLARSGIRLDSGVVDGSLIGIHYDPMLAKIISWAPTRDDAVRRLAAVLARSTIHGVRTNRDLLVRILQHPAFVAGATDTAFIDRHGLASLAASLADDATRSLSVLAAALASAAANRHAATVLGDMPSGWRNVVSQPQHKVFVIDDDEITVDYRISRGGLEVVGSPDVVLVSAEPSRVVLECAGVRRVFSVSSYGQLVCVDSALGSVALARVERFGDPAGQVTPGSLVAPMPGSVVRVAVAVGDSVVKGQPLMWLEAMKMQHEIHAPIAGVVTELAVAEGQQVEVGAVLAVVSEHSAEFEPTSEPIARTAAEDT